MNEQFINLATKKQSRLTDIKLTTVDQLDDKTKKQYKLREGMVVIETWNINNKLKVKIKNINSMHDYLLSFGKFKEAPFKINIPV